MVGEKPKRDQQVQQQSLFWPIILIGVGLIWLLNNLGVLQTANLAVLFRLWPLFLILIGLDMLVGHEAPRLRPLLAIGAVLLLAVLAIVGPSLGLSGGVDVETRAYALPVNDTETAEFRIDASSAPLQIKALADSNNLVETQIIDSGRIDIEADEGRNAAVSIAKRATFAFDWFLTESANRRWDIALTDRVPLSLELDLGSGASQLDLSALQLSGLVIESGSGNVALKLPGAAYSIESDHGSGRWVVDVPRDAAFDWRINDLGSGDLTVNVSPSVGIRLDVQDDASGDINLPLGWTQISGGDDEGVWESANYGRADDRISITVANRGSGSITVRQ